MQLLDPPRGLWAKLKRYVRPSFYEEYGFYLKLAFRVTPSTIDQLLGLLPYPTQDLATTLMTRRRWPFDQRRLPIASSVKVYLKTPVEGCCGPISPISTIAVKIGTDPVTMYSRKRREEYVLRRAATDLSSIRARVEDELRKLAVRLQEQADQQGVH